MDINDIVRTHKRSGLLDIKNEKAKEILRQLEENVYNSDFAQAKKLRDEFYKNYRDIAQEIEKNDPTFWPSINALIAKSEINIK